MTLVKKSVEKIKFADIIRLSKYKNAFAKIYTLNWLEEATVIKEVKNTVPWTYVIDDLNGEEINGTFCEKESQKTNEKEFRIENIIKKKGNKLYVKWKGGNILFNSWIDRKDRINAPTNLSTLRIKVDKLDVDKSVPVPVNLVKLSDVVKNDVVKKTEYSESVKTFKKISTSDSSDLVKKKTDYNTKINEIENNHPFGH